MSAILSRIDEGNRWVEVGARDRAEGEYEGYESSVCCNGISQESDRHVSAG